MPQKALKGDLSGIKNVNDWINNGAQGIGKGSEYYKKAVEIGDGISKTPALISLVIH